MSLIHSARVLLIRTAKSLPFIVCAAIFISYAESALALYTGDFVVWDGYVIPNKPVSWAIGGILEYSWNTVIVLFILSVSVETCIYNKLACICMCVNLIEKSYFDFEMDVWTVSFICILNMEASGFLVYKGTVVLFGNR